MAVYIRSNSQRARYCTDPILADTYPGEEGSWRYGALLNRLWNQGGLIYPPPIR